MPYLKVRGFVIREVQVGDADRIINILTADLGLISVSARGARRTKSPLLMPTQIFALSEFDLFANKGHYTVNTAELTEPFMALHQDIDRLVCASHLAEVLLDCTRDADCQPELYQLWAFIMQALQSQPDPILTTHLAQMRLLALIGYSPCTDGCVSCGAPIEGKSWFSIRSCGIICSKPACRKQAGDALALSPGVLDCLNHCLNAPFSRLFNCRLSPEARRDFILLSERYLTHQMEKKYTRLKMLEGLDSLLIQSPGSV